MKTNTKLPFLLSLSLGFMISSSSAQIQDEIIIWNEDMGPLFDYDFLYQPPVVINNFFNSTNMVGPVIQSSLNFPDQAASSDDHLSIDDIKTVLAQGIAQAKSLNAPASLAVVDRVGNVLAVYRMAGAQTKLTISTTQPATVDSGLDNVILPNEFMGTELSGDALAVITKAITGAYLSSSGNAFTTRTANQIIQDHFNPGERNQPSGPLFGVQFSQLACSDFSLRYDENKTIGPQRSPLGLAADSGGFPLFKNGVVVGGVGVLSDNHYGIDKNILDFDVDNDEIIGLAATLGYLPDVDVKANRITVDGKTLRYSDVTLSDVTQGALSAASFDGLNATDGSLISVQGYTNGLIKRGTVFGDAESGVVADDKDYDGLDAFVFVDENGDERFRPKAGQDAPQLSGTNPLSESEVREILRSALDVANRARAQIRRPLGSQARVTISVVDTQGNILGITRTRDAPIFGSDVSLQKARTAAFFSNADAADFLNSFTIQTDYIEIGESLMIKEQIAIPDYVTAVKNFVGANALSDGTAFSDRAGGNLSRPFYSDGIENNPHGPLSKSFRENKWSVFSTGFQLDLVMNKIIKHVFFAAGATTDDTNQNCTEKSSLRLANGIQIFPGSVPIYRGDKLIGGIGVSGDGVDQDDMISFLGVHNAGVNLNGAINNAPANMRADNLTPQGTRLRFVQCPQSPFLNSSVQNVCQGK